MQAELLRVGDVVISELDIRNLTDDEIVELNDFGNLMGAESRPEDPPTPIELARAGMRNIPDFAAIRLFVARDADGSIAAVANAAFMRVEENKHLLETSISVRPDARRRGIATALLRLALDVADSEGRTLVVSATSERVSAGEAFAEAVGAEAAQANHINRLVLADVDRDLVRRWIDDGPRRAPGYSLEWLDGIFPDDKLEEILDVLAVMNDAPRDDMQIEDTRWTPERYRDAVKGVEALGVEMWWLFARHDETGQLVGLTDVSWIPAEPDRISQGNTGVRPEHRGHALGKWLKATMLQRIFDERTQAAEIRTGNADSNDAMLGINRKLGFKPHRAHTTWQVTTEQVRVYLDTR
jgi:GNAT superfamily N-acetyltransferase